MQNLSRVTCRNFGKELVILFHRTAAAPWGHVASIIKRSSTGDSLSLFGFTTNTGSTVPFFVAAPWRHTYLVPSTAGTQERRTHVLGLKVQDTHSVKFQQAFHLQTHFTFTNLIKPTLASNPFTYLQTLSQNLYLIKPTLPSQTFTNLLYLQLYNLHNKPNHILHLELFLELSLLNSSNSLFIPFGVKPCLLLLLLLYINFVARKRRASLYSKADSPNLSCCWITVYSFTKRRNKPGFSGLIKIPINSLSRGLTLKSWLLVIVICLAHCQSYFTNVCGIDKHRTRNTIIKFCSTNKIFKCIYIYIYEGGRKSSYVEDISAVNYFFINEIQSLENCWKKCVDRKYWKVNLIWSHSELFSWPSYLSIHLSIYLLNFLISSNYHKLYIYWVTAMFLCEPIWIILRLQSNTLTIILREFLHRCN